MSINNPSGSAIALLQDGMSKGNLTQQLRIDSQCLELLRVKVAKLLRQSSALFALLNPLK